MEVSKINSTQNFNARLCGDFRQVISISKDGGMPTKAIGRLLNEVQNLLPNKKDRVFFIFRKPYYEHSGEVFCPPFKVRSQVEVLKEGDIFNSQGLRANVYPFKGEQKDLLAGFIDTLRKLLKGEIKPEKTRSFYPERKHPWLENYHYDKRIKTGWVNFDEGLRK